MIPERYERYKPPHNIHHYMLYGLAVGIIAAILILTISIEALRRDMQSIRTAQKNLNKRFHVDYFYDPPPAWMKK